MLEVVERFLKYVKIDTQADPESDSFPSTKKQFNLAKVLVEEMNELGLENVSLDEYGYVMGTLSANTEKKVPTIGFIAHMDTSPDMSGKDVKPQFIENYDGGDIELNKDNNVVLSPEQFPELKNYIGNTLITTDGTTLLGADDKGGIAEILTAVHCLKKNPQIEHGTIRIAFTPDEEIGKGAKHFDLEKFNADFAYTIDGSKLGELVYENFNATNARVTIQGINVHPGRAKDRMKNSITIAMELQSMLPASQKPEHTSDYEGFFHLNEISGNVDQTRCKYIIRDHDLNKLRAKTELMQQTVDFLNKKYGEGTINLDMKEIYYNMRTQIEPHMHIVDLAKKAYRKAGVEPVIAPIRGGTDGARLSYMGLPTPNIFVGGINGHGKYEFIPVESMEKVVQIIVNIAELNCQ